MKRVLFLCIGNSCRSQMAEGFANRYGSDVLQAFSAGLSPAPIIQPLTKVVMEAKNINLDKQFPKDLNKVDIPTFDLIINLSGQKLPARLAIEVRDWPIQDPIGQNEDVYVAVRDQIEMLVMRLILELRKASQPASPAPTPRSPTKRALNTGHKH